MTSADAGVVTADDIVLPARGGLVEIPLNAIHIPAGGSSGEQVRVRSVRPGTARIYFTAPGYKPDSTLPNIVGP